MPGFENQKIIQNLVTLENCLILNDNFLELSLQRKIFSQRMFHDRMRNKSPSLGYSMKLLHRGPDTFIQFVDILIEIKQNDIVIII